MTGTVTESSLRTVAQRAADDGVAGRIVAVAAPPEWNGPGEIEIESDGGVYEVHGCVSVLAMRALLARLEPEQGRRLILLTSLPDHELGDEVLARLWKHRVHQLSGWDAARQLFRVNRMDPALADHRWLVELLVEVVPPRGYPPPASGFLDLDTAWRTLLRFGLQLESERPNSEDLLRWGESETARSALQGHLSKATAEIAAGLERRAGPVARHVIRLAAAGRGADLVPLGIVCDVLWGDDHRAESVELTTARVRLEGPVGEKGLTAQLAREWGQAAVGLVQRAHAVADDDTVQRWLSRAEALLISELGAPELAVASRVLPSAFEQRLRRAGDAVAEALREPGADAIHALRAAVGSVRDHLRAGDDADADRVARLQMGERLVHRLGAAESAPAEDLAAAARHFVADGAWVDRAREFLSHGETVESLATAYGTLLERIDTIREGRAREFATLLAVWSSVAPTDRAPLLPIERVLDDVVVAIAKKQPALLLVLDGWSHPEATRLNEDLRKAGWVRHRPEGQEHAIVVSALPSVTSVSRTSLLSGRLAHGTQDDERKNWAAHEGLKAVSRRAEPRLFHRRDLGSSEGHIAPEVRDAVLDPDVQVVGVVVNALDEHLDKGGQLRLADGLQGIRPLRPLLDAALESGRVVVLASDHGHVLEFGSRVTRHGGAGERWRPNHPPAADDEVEIKGPRVLLEKGSIVVPATEGLRYISVEKRGYHGGATPQEVLCPLVVMTPPGVAVPGWEPADVLPPEWWDPSRPEVRAPGDEPAVPLRLSWPPPAPTVDPDGQVQLFDEVETGPAWLAALLESAVLEGQRELAGRQALGDEDVVAFLKVLDAAGGVLPVQALAEALDLPMNRVFSKLAALRRMLNVDGYAVVGTEGDQTIRFDRERLILQFRLDS